MMRLLLIILLFSSSAFSQTRTLNEIDRVRGYLEYRLGKKYHFQAAQDSNSLTGDSYDTKHSILRYTHFYGVPIANIHIETDREQRIKKIKFSFDDSDREVSSADQLLDLFGEPHYQASTDKHEIKRFWQLRKVYLLMTEIQSDQSNSLLITSR